jgi:Mg2+ and Co2+ transporter CorA
LANQLDIIKVVREMKPWLMTQEKKAELEENFIKTAGIHPPPRTPSYKKEERTKVDLL